MRAVPESDRTAVIEGADLRRGNMKWKKLHEGIFILAALWFLQLILPISQSFALNVTLAWDPSEENELNGYFVCYKQGTAGDPGRLGTYDTIIKVPINDPGDPNCLADPSKPKFTISGLDGNLSYYFVVAAYGIQGTSKGSHEVFILGSDGIPTEYNHDYDRAWGISSGDLRGFMFLYSSTETVFPTFGSSQTIPAFSVHGYDSVGPRLNLLVEPPEAEGFTFRVPVTLLIPAPDGYDAEELSIGLFESEWTLVWDGESKTQKAGWDWLATEPLYHLTNPFSLSGPPLIELVVNHFTGIQAAVTSSGSGTTAGGGGGGGCFISALAGK
jgi:hypothetical protein